MNHGIFWSIPILLCGAAAAWATEVTLDGLKSKTPNAWKAAEPSNKFRAYQFTLPAKGGDKEDGELVIFFFGAGGGGGTKANIDRWLTMFEAPKGKAIEDISKVSTIELPKAKLTYVDITGTYLSKFPPFAPNAKVTRKENYRRLGVVFESENGPYFITVTGPNTTVEGHKMDFDAWLKNFK